MLSIPNSFVKISQYILGFDKSFVFCFLILQNNNN